MFCSNEIEAFGDVFVYVSCVTKLNEEHSHGLFSAFSCVNVGNWLYGLTYSTIFV